MKFNNLKDYKEFTKAKNKDYDKHQIFVYIKSQLDMLLKLVNKDPKNEYRMQLEEKDKKYNALKKQYDSLIIKLKEDISIKKIETKVRHLEGNPSSSSQNNLNMYSLQSLDNNTKIHSRNNLLKNETTSQKNLTSANNLGMNSDSLMPKVGGSGKKFILKNYKEYLFVFT